MLLRNCRSYRRIISELNRTGAEILVGHIQKSPRASQLDETPELPPNVIWPERLPDQ